MVPLGFVKATDIDFGFVAADREILLAIAHCDGVGKKLSRFAAPTSYYRFTMARQ